MSAPARSCQSCSQCCHSVPVKELNLPAFTPCRHERAMPHTRTDIYRRDGIEFRVDKLTAYERFQE